MLDERRREVMSEMRKEGILKKQYIWKEGRTKRIKIEMYV